ncbi:glutamyl-tRNA reductase [uncultured Ruminococcus sp.]|uniref:glutamyl-tRNA reductase n=1 Tax=uncultured Ruminococcus sp. TaxID=165186 RepID=UPI0026302D11|nr:glutamyl-tRNA reductase [uncultured Ruminococcus sp.]
MKNFTCISINHKLCGQSFRSLFTFDSSQREKLLFDVKDLSPVLICTCNRTELYFCGTPEEGIRLLCSHSGVEVAQLKRKVMIFTGRTAIKRLYSVACGIESLVIGEDEILGQLRRAYDFSRERIVLSSDVNMIFQGAIACAKKIKTQTELSKTSVSTATLAAKEAAHYKDDVKVMLLGASGEIGSLVLKNLLSYKNVTVLATARSHKNALEYISDDPKLELIPYEKRYQRIGECDCIISATSSPHYTITADMLENAADRLFIDLAVPRDIDPAVKRLTGARLIDMDFFTELAKENNARKLDSVERSKLIIDEETDELEKQLMFHDFLPQFEGLDKRLSEVSAKELFFRLKSELDSQAFSKVIDIIKEYGEL